MTSDGKMKIAPFVPQTKAVVGFVLKKGKVLLGERIKSSVNLGVGLYAGIGGKIGDSDKNSKETPEQALIREFEEEVKIFPTKFTRIGQATFIFKDKPQESKWNHTAIVYLIHEYRGEPRPTESIRPKWFNFSNLPFEKMWPDNWYWVPLAIKNIPFVGEFVYRDKERLEEVWVKIIRGQL